MDRYIEFIHEQSGDIITQTFTDVSTNNRIIKFQIITKDLFEYDGWYEYLLYEDYNKETLLDRGKCYLNNPKEVTTYDEDNNEKKIYNG